MNTRPPGVLPASKLPSLRTARTVTHGVSKSAIFFTLAAPSSATAYTRPWSPVPKNAVRPSWAMVPA